MTTEQRPTPTESVFYEQFARIGKALAAAGRVELLDLLCQGERSVEALAHASGMTVTNTSQHLQVLRSAALVEARKEGTRVIYRLAGEDVCRFFLALAELAHARLAEVDQLVRCYLEGDAFDPLTRGELLERVERGDVLVLDVRPAAEYAAGHIPGAVSVPLDQLEAQLQKLPAETEIVAYCRGPYCLLATSALELLDGNGFRARRLEDGLPEWRLAGLPIATGKDTTRRRSSSSTGRPTAPSTPTTDSGSPDRSPNGRAKRCGSS